MLSVQMRAFRVMLALYVAVLGTAAAEDKPSPAELQKLLDETDSIAKTVSDIRGLPVKKRIARGVLSREAIEKRLLERLEVDYAPGELRSEAVALKRLGLIPADMDYRQEI